MKGLTSIRVSSLKPNRFDRAFSKRHQSQIEAMAELENDQINKVCGLALTEQIEHQQKGEKPEPGH